MILGITGIFGSGKTTVAKLFAKQGYKHINVDKIGHKLLNKDMIKNIIVKRFGGGILTRGKIDRGKLKDIVFNDKKELSKLNKIIHPLIMVYTKSMVLYRKKVVIDGALLIEVKSLDFFDKVIVVKISKEEQLKRALKKGKYTKKEIQNILKSQLSQKEKLKYADIVVDNSKSLDNTKKQVNKIIGELK